jgi:[ribosomal protein S5]-alanine N-acetyltransferase
MTRMPVLETERLRIRPFEPTDLEAIHRILDVELADADLGTEGPGPIERRAEWLQWAAANCEQLARLYQPPYGDRAVVLRSSGELVGAVGFVPSFGPFHQLPSLAKPGDDAGNRLYSPEFGLYYAISTAHRRLGYCCEAVRAMIDYGFTALRLRRIVATTSYDNAASMRVMEKLGLRLERNPLPEPDWFQVVGIIENARARAATPSDGS